MDVEAIDAMPVCPSGALVCALLSLGLPLSAIAASSGVDRARLSMTVEAGGGRRCRCSTCMGRRMRADVLTEAEYLRVEALVGVEAGRGTGDVDGRVRAWLVGVG